MKKINKTHAVIMLLIFLGIAVLLWPTAIQLGGYYASRHSDYGVIAGIFAYLGVVIPILTISMVFAGLGLYVLSRSFRLVYGLVKITAGILSVVYTFRTSLD